MSKYYVKVWVFTACLPSDPGSGHQFWQNSFFRLKSHDRDTLSVWWSSRTSSFSTWLPSVSATQCLAILSKNLFSPAQRKPFDSWQDCYYNYTTDFSEKWRQWLELTTFEHGLYLERWKGYENAKTLILKLKG